MTLSSIAVMTLSSIAVIRNVDAHCTDASSLTLSIGFACSLPLSMSTACIAFCTHQVREHGREVRAACKDIRSRLRDSQLEKKSTADTNPPRPRPRLKATASYKRRPLHVTKAESRTRSESAPAAPGAPPIPPARSYRHIPALDHQVAAAMALAGSSSSSVATSAGPEETPAPAAGSSSSSLTAPSAGGRSARSSDAEELLREYGLDFSALRLRAGAATPDDVPSLPPTPPSTSPPSSLPPTPPATSPPRTPPLPARPGG
ncbi:Protein of unknown function [Gryllus bimaculatus]|nr:Protein of unknown function [Gryllus bimaculatus]